MLRLAAADSNLLLRQQLLLQLHRLQLVRERRCFSYLLKVMASEGKLFCSQVKDRRSREYVLQTIAFTYYVHAIVFSKKKRFAVFVSYDMEKYQKLD